MNLSKQSKSVLSAILLLSFAHGLLLSVRAVNGETIVSSRIISSFDSDWRFRQGEVKDGEQTTLNDSDWRKLDVPHDWSIEGPFSKDNPTGRAGGYLPSGVGWYRKHFKLPTSESDRRVFIEFDGVMANSDVWINGVHLGKRPYGYVSFGYELTAQVKFGAEDNVIAVRADDSGQPASRWYSGAGIYRHVRLVITNQVHIERWSTFITTPAVTKDSATVHVRSTVVNQSNKPRTVSLLVAIAAPGNRNVQVAQTKPQTIPAGQSADFDQYVVVNNPQRWDIAHPFLYEAWTVVREGALTRDHERTSFGIREFKFEADSGFWLNGRNFKLKGVCLHHDGGAFGAAVPLRVWERRLEILRDLGVNAIRTAHNPPAPDFLDLCDRMGFIVMDELFDCWTVARIRTTIIYISKRLVAHRHARHGAARSQSSASWCTAPQRDSRHAETGNREADSGFAGCRVSQVRSDPAGDAGAVSAQRQSRL